MRFAFFAGFLSAAIIAIGVLVIVVEPWPRKGVAIFGLTVFSLGVIGLVKELA